MKNSKSHSVLLVLLLLTLGTLTEAYGQVTPSQDSYTNSTTPTTNYGAKTLLDVDAASQITYIQFDLSSIPAGTNVGQATLKLYVNSVATAGSFNVDYVNGTWSESKITYSLAPALGSAIASSVSITTADKNQYILVNITPAVQAWLSGGQTNDGIALVANGTFNATFDSKENTTTSHPPELDIVFAGGGTITGVTTASASGLTGGGTSGKLNLSLLNTCSSGQVLQWNGSAWVCANPKGSGTVTSVGSGVGLTGGPITTSGTLGIDPTAVPLLAAYNNFTSGQSIATSGNSDGLDVVANGVNINGILGLANATTGTGNGVFGWTKATAGYGVAGFNTAGGYGVFGQSTGANAAGVFGTNTSSGYGVLGRATGSTGQGVWGESLGTGFSNGAGSDGVHGVSHSTGGSGVAGVNDAKDATGVYGSDPQGYGFVTDSHVSQGRAAGGWVKAMAYVDFARGGSILRCYNSQISGSAASTPPCGMTAAAFASQLTVDFGFEVDDRFVLVSFTNPDGQQYYGLSSDGYFLSNTQVLVVDTSIFPSPAYIVVN